MRVALFGPDGRPAVFEGTADERNQTLAKAVMIECFGAMCGIQLKHEWPSLPGGPQAGLSQLLDAIVDQVGREALIARYGKYGFAFVAENPGGPPAEPVPPPPADPRAGHTDAGRPFKAIPGGKVGG